METRNPSEREIDEYDALAAAIEDARLQLEELEIDIRVKFALPSDVTVAGDGSFMLGPQRLRQKPKPGAPLRLQDRLPAEDLMRLVALRADVDRARHLQSKKAQELRAACRAPHFARLDSQWRWVSPDNPPRPIVAAEATQDAGEEGTIEPYELDEAPPASAVDPLIDGLVDAGEVA